VTSSTSKTTVFFAVKMCEQEQFARDFMAGSLYMNSLEYFRTCKGDDGRPDPHEGIAAIYQPESIGSIDVGPVTIPGKDLAPGVPLVALYDNAHMTAICSLFSANTVGFGNGIRSDQLAELKKVLVIHDKCHRLGTYAVLVKNIAEFGRRVDAAIRAAGLEGGYGLVKYFDFRKHNGRFDSPGLHKRSEYEYQREYRVVVYLPEGKAAPYRLEVGDLSDITVLTAPEIFNGALKIGLPDGTEA
jgi:hypothetical protein